MAFLRAQLPPHPPRALLHGGSLRELADLPGQLSEPTSGSLDPELGSDRKPIEQAVELLLDPQHRALPPFLKLPDEGKPAQLGPQALGLPHYLPADSLALGCSLRLFWSICIESVPRRTGPCFFIFPWPHSELSGRLRLRSHHDLGHVVNQPPVLATLDAALDREPGFSVPCHSTDQLEGAYRLHEDIEAYFGSHGWPQRRLFEMRAGVRDVSEDAHTLLASGRTQSIEASSKSRMLSVIHHVCRTPLPHRSAAYRSLEAPT